VNKYIPEIDDDWKHRATVLYKNTVLCKRQADVHALSEQGLSRREIANELDISINTVDAHRQKIKERVQLAENTLKELAPK